MRLHIALAFPVNCAMITSAANGANLSIALS
jgi:hypothetical protein